MKALHAIIIACSLCLACDDNQPAPVHRIEQQEDLGEIAFGEVGEFTFRVRNLTSYPIRVESIRKNCSCTVTDLVEGLIIDSGEDLLVQLTLSGGHLGGKRVGELLIGTNSTSPDFQSIRLTLTAEFPRAIWTEQNEFASDYVVHSKLELHSVLPGFLDAFRKVEVKPAGLRVTFESRESDCLHFAISQDEQLSTDWIYALAVFQFDDARCPVTTAVIPNPRNSRVKLMPANVEEQ